MDNLVDNHADYQDLTVREYAQHFNLPEQTVRSRIRMGKLSCVDVIRNGQTQRGIRVALSDLHNDNPDNQAANQLVMRPLSSDNQRITEKLSQIIPPDYQMIIDNNEARIKDLKESITKLEADNYEKSQKIEMLTKQLSDERERAARAEGELSSKDETIEALKGDLASKDKAINASNAAVLLMEQNNQTVDTSRQIESKGNKPWWRFGL